MIYVILLHSWGSCLLQLGAASTGVILSHKGYWGPIPAAGFSGLEAVCNFWKGTLKDVLRVLRAPSSELKLLTLDSIIHEIIQKLHVKNLCLNGSAPVLL